MLEVITDNPVFLRELRRRMRRRGLLVTMVLYIALMCFVAVLIIAHMSNVWTSQQQGAWLVGTTTLGEIGQAVFVSVIVIQAFLVLLIAPSMTASMLRAEREKETFELLKVTVIRPVAYVLGALMSTLLYVVLALLCALPVLTIAYLYGGVSHVGAWTLCLLAVSVVLSAAGLLSGVTLGRRRSRQVGGGLAGGLLVVMFLFFGLMLNMRLMGNGIVAPKQFAGFVMPVYLHVCVWSVLVTVFLVLIASRKVFRPTERALNYGQLAAATLLVVGLLTANGWIVGQPGQLGWAYAVGITWLVFGTFANATMVISITVAGSERWHLVRSVPLLARFDESLLYVFCFHLAGGAAFLSLVWCAFPGDTTRLQAGVPGLVFLAGHAGLCKWLQRRGGDVNRAGNLSVALAFAYVCVPLAAASGAYSSPGTTQGTVYALSPLSSAHLLASLTHPTHAYAGTGVTLIVGVLLWLAAFTTKPRAFDTDEL